MPLYSAVPRNNGVLNTVPRPSSVSGSPQRSPNSTSSCQTSWWSKKTTEDITHHGSKIQDRMALSWKLPYIIIQTTWTCGTDCWGWKGAIHIEQLGTLWNGSPTCWAQYTYLQKKWLDRGSCMDLRLFSQGVEWGGMTI